MHSQGIEGLHTYNNICLQKHLYQTHWRGHNEIWFAFFFWALLSFNHEAKAVEYNLKRSITHEQIADDSPGKLPRNTPWAKMCLY